MPEIIRGDAIAADDWQVLRPAPGAPSGAVDVPAGRVLVPLALWLERHEELLRRGDVGVWLSGGDEPDRIAPWVERLALVAVDFAKFTDGRGYSLAYLLRSRYGYRGELRAIGDVLPDQLFFMRRVGFDAFALRPDKDVRKALAFLRPFSDAYQGSWDDPQPAYRRHARGWPSPAPHREAGAGPDSPAATSPPAEALEARLRAIVAEYRNVAFASSLGAEDMVLTDAILGAGLPIAIFTLDTGRLHGETLALLQRIRERYGREIEVFRPLAAEVDRYVAQHGLNAFYESVELRKRCCHIRKVEPLKRALAGRDAWITGLRREQSITRAGLALREADSVHGIAKFNPLADWSEAQVWAYLRERAVPYNPLHERGYPSIGCEPCTRAIRPGEDIRAGRWWWEQRDSRECGLHVAPAESSAEATR
jgi:phosphoadenosine phosphosulfate reductase